MTTRPAISSSVTRFLVILALLIGACGGGNAAGDNDTETTSEAASVQETSDDAGAPDTTMDAEPGEDDEPAPGENSATISFAGETYRFAIVDGSGSCDPAMLDGSFLRALLTRVDDSGQVVAIDDPDQPALVEHVQIAVGTEEGVGERIINGYFGEAPWEAGEDGNDESSIDSITKEGNRAEGTATFLNTDSGEVVEGTFEVTCAGE